MYKKQRISRTCCFGQTSMDENTPLINKIDNPLTVHKGYFNTLCEESDKQVIVQEYGYISGRFAASADKCQAYYSQDFYTITDLVSGTLITGTRFVRNPQNLKELRQFFIALNSLYADHNFYPMRKPNCPHRKQEIKNFSDFLIELKRRIRNGERFAEM